MPKTLENGISGVPEIFMISEHLGKIFKHGRGYLSTIPTEKLLERFLNHIRV